MGPSPTTRRASAVLFLGGLEAQCRDGHFAFGKLLYEYDPHAGFKRKGPPLLRTLGTTDADLHRPFGIKESFFHRPPEVGAMGVLSAQFFIAGVGVRIDLHHADRSLRGDRP